MLNRCAMSVVCGLALSAVSQGATIATFADPTVSPTPSLFQYNTTSHTLSGGWSGTGLTLLTPGSSSPDFTDAKFTFSTMSGVEDMFGMVMFGTGSVQFFSSTDVPIMRIDFSNAMMASAIGVGGSDFVGFNVNITGSIVDSPTGLMDEAFAFSFANPTPTSTGWTVTAAFTSSGSPAIPSPGGTALVGLAMLLISGRRRTA